MLIELWKRSKIKQNLAIDTEILAALTEEYITSNLEKNKITGLSDYILGSCEESLRPQYYRSAWEIGICFQIMEVCIL